MTQSKKCCFCVGIKVGVICFGVGSLIIFAMLTVTSAVLLGLHDIYDQQQHIVIASQEFKVIIITVILVAILILSFLSFLSSIFFLIGISKRHPGLVLTYFTFGVLNTIVMFLGSLLFLMQSYWYISLPCFFVTAFYMYCLTVVYSVYELIQRAHVEFDINEQMDEELLSGE